MGNEKDSEDKGFVVKDRRFTAQKETEGTSQVKEEPKREEPGVEEAHRPGPLPEIDFANFIFSMNIQALIQLGEIQDPQTKESAKDLALAKQTIDIIGMLREKAKGNLNPDEEKLIEHILYDLRMKYVKAAG